ncbi:MAG: thiol oxidoreductase [Rhodobacteraceae bacterium]|nr:thiol oxidoreductase [Paracoccaceae bacterium]
MWRWAAILVLLGCGSTLSAAAQQLDDRHLPVMPRTPEEAALAADLAGVARGIPRPAADTALSAGAATVADSGGRDAFAQPSATLNPQERTDFAAGRALFRKVWIAAPSSLTGADGLGPLYNARACQDCHLHDGRTGPVQSGAAPAGLVLRLSRPGGVAPAAIADYLATAPDPIYGHLLQIQASPGQQAEAALDLTLQPQTVTLADGTTVTLQRPAYALAGPAYGPPAAGLMLSPRLAPRMIGLGLLEAIPAADILARADPQDADGDGISGRANIVISATDGQPMLGRFGLKAGIGTLREQTASAFSGDMGLSSPLQPAPWGDCTPAQTACRNAAHGQDAGKAIAVEVEVEVDAATVDLITHYARNLGVPARRAVNDPQVLRGEAIFHDTGCATCHAPVALTHRLIGQETQSFQIIHPYTDLLLHDMGEGLADHRPEARATGREWRTAALWGLGLATRVAGGEGRFLHDGRAPTVLAAILWHGGEAQGARDQVVALPTADRVALLAFLDSL